MTRSGPLMHHSHATSCATFAALTLCAALFITPGALFAQAASSTQSARITTTSQSTTSHPVTLADAANAERIAQELLLQFEASMEKFIALARAFPAERYTWSPGEGVMEVGHVLMHVARYNYAYPSQNMGVAAPTGVDLRTMESVRDRDEVLRALEQSRVYVRDAVRGMTGDALSQPTRLYGRELERWGVLVQLVAHMNEHLGQSIAYARMNGIVPPWSS